MAVDGSVWDIVGNGAGGDDSLSSDDLVDQVMAEQYGTQVVVEWSVFWW